MVQELNNAYWEELRVSRTWSSGSSRLTTFLGIKKGNLPTEDSLKVVPSQTNFCK